MNKKNDSIYALHNLWDWIRCEFKRIKGFYLLLPVIYICLIATIKPYMQISSSSINNHKFDAYKEIVVTDDIKLDYILNKYELTKSEFDIVAAITLAESGSNSYEDAYAVINTIYNRTHSKNWVSTVNNHFGRDKGYSLYYQSISPGQFTVYKSGTYKRHLGETKSNGYKAIIDFLYTEEVMHDYLSFRAHWVNVNEYECFAKNGNKYFNKITEKNRI